MAEDGQGQGWVSRTLEASGAGSEASAAAGNSTFIDQGAIFDGRLRTVGTLRLDGEFKGEIFCDTVVVGEAAGIEASIYARSVLVSGAIAGRIEASREVVLRPTARLHADVDAPSFVVERGAVLNGQTRMIRPEQRARAESRSVPATPNVSETPEPSAGAFATR